MNTDKNPQKIKNMFDEISKYYDITNNFISLFSHKRIKYSAIKNLKIKPKSMVLDICCGTGDLTGIISKLIPDAKIIGVDFSQNMLEIAKQKYKKIAFLESDVTNLPFKDNEFDYVTEGFGLRNIENRQKAIKEIYRILKPDGKFLHIDFGIHNFVWKCFDLILPFFIKISKISPDSYKYLIDSKNTFPAPNELIQEFQNTDFKLVEVNNYMFGAICAIIFVK